MVHWPAAKAGIVAVADLARTLPVDVRTRARAWRHGGRRARRPARSWAAVDALPAGGLVLTYNGGEGASEHSAGCERRSARSAAVLAGTPCGGNMLWRDVPN